MNTLLAFANAIATALSLVCMLRGRAAIRRKDVSSHRRWMIAATAFSALFAVGFVVRFVRYGFTPWEGQGALRYVYLAAFYSHEPLAVVNVPLVLAALALGVRGSFRGHREVARMAYPVWKYVAATGLVLFVLLYLLNPRP